MAFLEATVPLSSPGELHWPKLASPGERPEVALEILKSNHLTFWEEEIWSGGTGRLNLPSNTPKR